MEISPTSQPILRREHKAATYAPSKQLTNTSEKVKNTVQIPNLLTQKITVQPQKHTYQKSPPLSPGMSQVQQTLQA